MRTLTKEDISAIIKRLDDKHMIDPSSIKEVLQSGQNICVGCGCSDLCACPEGCYWLDIDESSQFGICSECKDYETEYK